MKISVIMMSAVVEIAGKTISSGSRLFLNEMNITFVVIRVVTKPKNIVATMTIKIDGKSAEVIPQKRVPNSIAIPLIVVLVTRVRTTIAPIIL